MSSLKNKHSEEEEHLSSSVLTVKCKAALASAPGRQDPPWPLRALLAPGNASGEGRAARLCLSPMASLF